MEFAVDTSLEALSTGDFDRGRSVLKLVVESPLDDDWEDAALTRVNQHVSPILSTIREVTRQTDSWSPQFKDPISQECAQVEALADLLRGRVLAVREWDMTLQQWTDKKAILMCNYAVDSVNKVMTEAEANNFASSLPKLRLLLELRDRLENAEKLILQALDLKISAQTERHLSETLRETREILSSISELLLRELRTPRTLVAQEHPARGNFTSISELILQPSYPTRDKKDMQTELGLATRSRSDSVVDKLLCCEEAFHASQQSTNNKSSSAANFILMLLFLTILLSTCFCLLYTSPSPRDS